MLSFQQKTDLQLRSDIPSLQNVGIAHSPQIEIRRFDEFIANFHKGSGRISVVFNNAEANDTQSRFNTSSWLCTNAGININKAIKLSPIDAFILVEFGVKVTTIIPLKTGA